MFSILPPPPLDHYHPVDTEDIIRNAEVVVPHVNDEDMNIIKFDKKKSGQRRQLFDAKYAWGRGNTTYTPDAIVVQILTSGVPQTE